MQDNGSNLGESIGVPPNNSLKHDSELQKIPSVDDNSSFRNLSRSRSLIDEDDDDDDECSALEEKRVEKNKISLAQKLNFLSAEHQKGKVLFNVD